jgi:predicted nucleic acid-binding protein
MNFASIPAGAAIFLDANTLICHFSNHAQYGAACTQLVKRIELQQLDGFTSAHVLSDVAHRLMALEAAGLPGWTYKGIVTRLRKHHAEIPKLTVFPQAIAGIRRMRIQVFPVTLDLVESATQLSQHHELLTGDALIIAVMQTHGLTNVASLDPDFDRLPGITRYAPA